VLGAQLRARAQLRQARRELVTGALERSQIRQARFATGRGTRRRGRRGDERKTVGEDRGKLELELCDLRAQRRPCGALGILVRLDRNARLAHCWWVAALHLLPLRRRPAA
jgi:hypothetical protein